jgi:hypothetical protein
MKQVICFPLCRSSFSDQILCQKFVSDILIEELLNYRIILNTAQCHSVCGYLLHLHVSVARPSSEGIRSTRSEATITKIRKRILKKVFI